MPVLAIESFDTHRSGGVVSAGAGDRADPAQLQAALIDLGVLGLEVAKAPPLQHEYDEARLRSEQVGSLSPTGGELKLVAQPAGVPRGYEALRAGATTEHLGNGLRTEVAARAPT